MIVKTKLVRISDEPLGCQVIFSDTELQFDKINLAGLLVSKRMFIS